MNYVLHGNIIYTPTKEQFEIRPNHYLVCEAGKVAGIYPDIPDKYRNFKLYEYEDCIITPGLCDTHLHAPQYAFRGLGMDMKLLDWLNQHAFLEEMAYEDLEYAKTAYTQFVSDLKKSATTRAAIFATRHIPATLLLMELLEAAGMCCLVGKVNMDRNAVPGLVDEPAAIALEQTEAWIVESRNRFKRVLPIVTPRFVPSCSNEVLEGLGRLARKYNLPVQSHLSENQGEIDWVRELHPDRASYADVYAEYDLFGDGTPTVMAHCVHCDEGERQMLAKRGVLVSHCPSSNVNLTSGIAPIRRYLEEGIAVGLGTDIAAGHDLSMFRAMADAVQLSKLHSYYEDSSEKPLRIAEVFYMGTKGAAPLFGRVGSFEEGYEFDAIVLDDHQMLSPRTLSLEQRIERIVYLEKEVKIVDKYVGGCRIQQ